jgi:glycosyltransferase involved in cell wall biosynthesis
MDRSQYLYYRGETPVFVSDLQLTPDDKTLKCLVLPEGQLTPENFGKYLVREGQVIDRENIPRDMLRVAMISDYGIKCGIATYTKFLCDALRPLVRELKIFAEEAATANPEQDLEDQVIRCWDRMGDYSRIPVLMKKFDPDIIFIQHEFGLFHQVDAWNSLLSQLSHWRTVTVFHTVLEHNVPNREARLDYTCRALSEAACPEIIVHSPKARATLLDRGYSGLVHHIPHGCFDPSPERLPSTKYGMFPKHSIFQYGFGSKHKGWETALDVVDQLKDKYPDLMYIGMFSLSEFGSEGQIAYHKQLLDMIQERGLSKHCAIHRGFSSEQMLSNFIRSTRVCLFPYKAPNSNWASWGASGAIQRPLSHGVPVVLSDFSQFAEYEGILPICKTTEEMVSTIDRIFSDPAYEKELCDTALKLSEDRKWSRVADWYLSCTSKKEFNAP